MSSSRDVEHIWSTFGTRWFRWNFGTIIAVNFVATCLLLRINVYGRCIKAPKIIYVKELNDLMHAHISFKENSDQSASECKCCGSVAPVLGTVDFAKTCMDRLGPPVFEKTGCSVTYHKCSKCGFIYTKFADEWSDNTISEMIYNEDYGKADWVTPGWEAGESDPRLTISYENGLKLINNLGITSDQDLQELDFGAGGNPGPTGLCFEDTDFDLTSYEPYLCDGVTQLKYDRYDLIYSIEVFEYVINLTNLCDFMARHLSDRGLMYV